MAHVDIAADLNSEDETGSRVDVPRRGARPVDHPTGRGRRRRLRAHPGRLRGRRPRREARRHGRPPPRVAGDHRAVPAPPRPHRSLTAHRSGEPGDVPLDVASEVAHASVDVLRPQRQGPQRGPPDAQQLAHLTLRQEHRGEWLARIEVEGELLPAALGARLLVACQSASSCSFLTPTTGLSTSVFGHISVAATVVRSRCGVSARRVARLVVAGSSCGSSRRCQ